MSGPRFEGARALVTGGLGFIGSNLAQALTREGAEVTVLDALLPQYGGNLANVKEIRERVRVEQGDIRDAPLVRRLVEGCDLVFDCAAQISHQISVRDPFLDVDINCRGALTVLEAVRAGAPRARCVYASTRGVIGRRVYAPPALIDEKHPTEPVDMNGIDKLAAEKYYRLYFQLHGVRSASLRISNTFGPRGQMRNDDYGVINWFLRRAMLREPIVLHGEGRQTRDYNYVDDVVEAFLLAAARLDDDASGVAGEAFMLGTGRETSLIDMVRMILEVTGSKDEVHKIPRPGEREAIEIGDYVVTIEKARRLLGWEPRVGIREGLERTHAFYLERMQEYL